jgi:hypothetical protein
MRLPPSPERSWLNGAPQSRWNWLSRDRDTPEARIAIRMGIIEMLDLILLGLGLGFFVLAVGYTIACDRL